MMQLYELLSLLLAFLAALRVRGCFYALLLSCCIAIAVYLAKRNSQYFVIPNQTKISACILALYQSLVFVAYRAAHGFSLQETLYVINVPLLYTVGSLWALSAANSKNKDLSNAPLSLLPFFYTTGGFLGSISSVIALHQASAATLRPHELLFSIVLLIALIGLVELPKLCKSILYYSLPIGLIVFISSLQFRGVIGFISGIMFFAFVLTLNTTRWRLPANKRILTIFAVACILTPIAAFILIDLRGLIFKWTLYSFISDDPFNGRLELWKYSLLAFDKVGLFSGVGKLPIDGHNFILNTISHSGVIPSFLVATVISYAFLALCFSSRRSEKKWQIGIFVVLILGSLIQPVQFSDGIAYQLSFFAIGALSASSFASQSISST